MPKYEKGTLLLTINEQGKIINALDMGGNPPTPAKIKKGSGKMKGTRFARPNTCCWRRIGGRWQCIPC